MPPHAKMGAAFLLQKKPFGSKALAAAIEAAIASKSAPRGLAGR
jgi:hypothetical protein